MTKKKIEHKAHKVPAPHASVKNASHAKHSGQKTKKSYKPALILAIIAMLVVASAAYYVMNMDKVLATVNGESILKSEVIDQYNGLRTQYGSDITMDIALNQTIIERLLMQDAKRAGIVITDDALNAFIDDSLARSGQTRESFDATLKAQNLSYNKIKERIRVQLAITSLVNQTFSEIEVTDKEVKDFYDQNKQLFADQKYDAVKEQIMDYLKSQKQVKEFQEYVLNLRQNADIVMK